MSKGNNRSPTKSTNLNRQIRSASDDRALEPFNSNQSISCQKADPDIIAKTAVLNLILRDSNFSSLFGKLGGHQQLAYLKNYLKDKKEPKDILKYTNSNTPVSIIKKLVEIIKEKPCDDLIETKEGQLKDVPLLIVQPVINPKIHITYIKPEKVSLEFVDTLSKVQLKTNRLGLRGIILRKNAQAAALVYCGNKTWLLWKFFNEIKYDKYSNAILELVDSGFYPEIIMYSSTSNPDDSKIDLEIYRNLIFSDAPPIEESKIMLNSPPDLNKFTNAFEIKDFAIKETPSKNVQKTSQPIKPNYEAKQNENVFSDNKKSGETDSTWGSFGQKNSFFEEKKIVEEKKIETKKYDVGVNDDIKTWKCKVCSSKVRLEKVECECGYRNLLLAKAHAVGFKAGKPCINCGEYSKDILCLKCVEKNYWSCSYCTLINNGGRVCSGCEKSKLNR